MDELYGAYAQATSDSERAALEKAISNQEDRLADAFALELLQSSEIGGRLEERLREDPDILAKDPKLMDEVRATFFGKNIHGSVADQEEGHVQSEDVVGASSIKNKDS